MALPIGGIIIATLSTMIAQVGERTMQEAAGLLICVLATLPATASAAGGVNFAWTACLDEGGTQRKNSTCSSSMGSHGTAVGTYVLDEPQPFKVGDEIIVDIQATTATLPPWWQFFNPGSCRPNALTANAVFGQPLTYCLDPWGSLPPSGGVVAYLTPSLPPNSARAVLAFTRNSPASLDAGQEYYSFQLTIGNALTTLCPGCTVPVTLILNEIKSTEVDGSFHRLNAPVQNNCIGFQWTPDAHACGATPMRTQTWGQIKGLYR